MSRKGILGKKVAKPELNGFVAISFVSLNLENNVRRYVNNSNGYEFAVFGEDLGHADLFADDAFLHCLYLLGYWFRRRADQATSSHFDIGKPRAILGSLREHDLACGIPSHLLTLKLNIKEQACGE